MLICVSVTWHYWPNAVYLSFFIIALDIFLSHHVEWFFNDSEQTTSRRLADRKIARFEKNITKRGSVPETVKKANDYPVGPILLGFFVFVVVGSCKSLCFWGFVVDGLPGYSFAFNSWVHMLSGILPNQVGSICSNISIIINPKFLTQFLVSCYLY